MRLLCGLLCASSVLLIWLFWEPPVVGELPSGQALDAGLPLPIAPGKGFELQGEIVLADGDTASGVGGMYIFDEVREFKQGGIGGLSREVLSYSRPRLTLRLPGSVVLSLEGRDYRITKAPTRVGVEKSWKDVRRYVWGFRPRDTATVRGRIGDDGRPVAESVQRGPARAALFPEEQAPRTWAAVILHWLGKGTLSLVLLAAGSWMLKPTGSARSTR